ncbi:hypothetical protein [Arthrobacter sp. D5-1]|uniref:hypothetical protein n=1 Tax=Arthrobacter sp. D5-1 TaxID=1477518 RepID=UPI001A9897FC|nr:hypothetical protein [Arthrobacter sp. D5-1]
MRLRPPVSTIVLYSARGNEANSVVDGITAAQALERTDGKSVASYLTSLERCPPPTRAAPVRRPQRREPALVLDVRSKTEHKARLVAGYSSSAVAVPCGASTRFPRKAQ